MIHGLFDQPNYVAAKKLLEVTVARHEAIANNLANIETPGYKRVDLAPSFAAQLQSAIASRDPAQISSIQPQITPDASAIGNGRDGNTVQLERELAELNKNSLAHMMETQLITGNLNRLRAAISGKSV